MGVRMIGICILGILGIMSIWGLSGISATSFDDISFGVQAVVGNNTISNVVFYQPGNNTLASWYNGNSGQVRLAINVSCSVGAIMNVTWYNRSDGWYTLGNTYGEKGDGEYDTVYFTCTGLSYNTDYQWSVNVSLNGTSETWNTTTYFNFSTPLSQWGHTFDSIIFGVQAVVGDGGGGTWTSFDSISYGVQAVVESGDTGWTSNSTYWEFYKLDDRYDIYNIGDGVDINDIYKVYLQAQTTFDYLYDVYPGYVGDGNVDVNDYYMVYLNVD